MVENDLSGCIGGPLKNGLAGILVRVFYRAGLAVINIKRGLGVGIVKMDRQASFFLRAMDRKKEDVHEKQG